MLEVQAAAHIVHTGSEYFQESIVLQTQILLQFVQGVSNSCDDVDGYIVIVGMHWIFVQLHTTVHFNKTKSNKDTYQYISNTDK